MNQDSCVTVMLGAFSIPFLEDFKGQVIKLVLLSRYC